MKKRICIFLAISIFFSLSAKVEAVELSIDGKFIIEAFGYNGLNFNKDTSNLTIPVGKPNKNSGFDVWQRVQIGLDFVASETLKGRFMLRVPNVSLWGDETFNTGALASNNPNYFQIEEAYIDFTIPSTEISVKAGMQGYGLTYMFNYGSPIVYDYLPGVTVNIPINDFLALNLAWFRTDTANENIDGGGILSASNAYADFFMLDMPITFDKMLFNPHIAYGSVGANAELQAYAGPSNPFESSFDVYYTGIRSEITLFDPITIAADFLYSWADGIGVNNAKARAWLADMAIAYNTGNGSLKLFGWYATGDDSDDVSKNEYGRIPSISAGWGTVKSVFFDEPGLGIGATSGVVSPTGTWALGLEYDGLKVVNDVSIGGHVLWINGTNDSSIAYFNGTEERNADYMSNEDSVIDFSAWLSYDMYKELQMNMHFSYLLAQFKEENYAGEEEDGFRAGVSFIYSF